MAKVSFLVMSSIKCACGKYIKQNLVNKKASKNLMCYRCFKVAIIETRPGYHGQGREHES